MSVAVCLLGRFSVVVDGVAFVHGGLVPEVAALGCAELNARVKREINQDFQKIRAALPKFMEEVNASPVFQGSDVNLKFNKPQIDISIDRDRARSLGVSIVDIAQTLQLAFSGASRPAAEASMRACWAWSCSASRRWTTRNRRTCGSTAAGAGCSRC